MDAIEKLASRMSSSRLLVLGDLMAEKYIWGDHLRIGDEAPVPIMRRVREKYEIGGAARLARSLKVLGAEVFLCGIVGFDDAAFSLRQAITAIGIGTGGLFPSETRPTTLKVRFMSEAHRQMLFRLDSESDRALTDPERASVRGYVEAMLAEVDALVLCDYQKGTFGAASFDRWLIDTATQRGVKTIVLSRPPGLGSFAGASAVVSTAGSAREFMYLRGRGFPTDLRSAGQEMRELLHCGSLVVIHEPGGISEWSADGGGIFISTPAIGLDGATAVEEAVTGVLAAGIASGIDKDQAMELVAQAATVAASRDEPDPVTIEMLRALRNSSHPPEER